MGQRRKKIPPTPGFEPQVTRCLVGATLASPPGGMDYFEACISNASVFSENNFGIIG